MRKEIMNGVISKWNCAKGAVFESLSRSIRKHYDGSKPAYVIGLFSVGKSCRKKIPMKESRVFHNRLVEQLP